MSDAKDVSFLFDTDVASFCNNSIRATYETTMLSITLHGLRTSFNRVIQSNTPIEFAFTDRMKELLEKRHGYKLVYPYAYIVLNDLDLVKDQINTAAMARHGVRRSTIQGDSIPIGFNFPLKLNITLNIVDSDIIRLLSLSQSILLSDASRAFNFAINARNSITKVKVNRTSNISYPESIINIETENDYASGRITVTFEVQSRFGFIGLLPKIRQFNIGVYCVDKLPDSETEVTSYDDAQKIGTYTINLEEGEDGENSLNKLFTPAK